MCKKDSPIEELSRKVSAIENILYVKDDQIKPLMEKVKVVEKKARKLWTSKTWSLWIWTNLYKSFRYLHWLWSRTNFWGDLEQHVNNLHKLHNWQYCSFTSESGLKAHTSKYNIINSNLDFEENICELFALREIGLLPLSMDYFDSDWWTRW